MTSGAVSWAVVTPGMKAPFGNKSAGQWAWNMLDPHRILFMRAVFADMFRRLSSKGGKICTGSSAVTRTPISLSTACVITLSSVVSVAMSCTPTRTSRSLMIPPTATAHKAIVATRALGCCAEQKDTREIREKAESQRRVAPVFGPLPSLARLT